MKEYLPYIIPGLFGLAGIILGALVVRLLSGSETRAVTLSAINKQLSEVLTQLADNLLKILQLEKDMAETTEQLKETNRKYENLKNEFEKLRSAEWLARKQAEAWKQQLVEAGISPVYVSI